MVDGRRLLTSAPQGAREFESHLLRISLAVILVGGQDGNARVLKTRGRKP